MVKKVIGISLMVLGSFIALVLFTYGGPIFPHITGPVLLLSVGAALVWIQRKGKQAQ
jgi:hypothetical protein